MNTATLEAPFSFHCVICIFPFNLQDRSPVVLPCGHTYICEACSKRLNKCMECRTSLTLRPPSHTTAVGTSATTPSASQPWHQPQPGTPISPRNRSTYSMHRKRETYYNSNSTPNKKQPPATAEPIPLPIPKNHVLIALMEAAERKKRATLEASYDSDTDEGEDIKHVLSGIETMNSFCGTYIVRDHDGLAIFPTNPYDMSLKKVPSYLKQPAVLQYGQRVQIVDKTDQDIFKLARNEGYIRADETQLVKIGMASEKACEIEGMLSTVQSSKENLLKQLENISIAENNLKQELDGVLMQPPEHPIIEDYRPMDPAEIENDQTLPSPNSEIDNKKRFEIGTSLSEESLGSPTPSSPPEPSLTRQVLFLNDDDATAYSDTALQTKMHRSVSPLVTSRGPFICGGSLFPLLRSGSDEENIERNMPAFRPNRTFLEGERSPRLNENVDFRTGLSGHTAFNITKRKQVATTQNRRHDVRFLYGEHRGIAPLRKYRKPQESPR